MPLKREAAIWIPSASLTMRFGWVMRRPSVSDGFSKDKEEYVVLVNDSPDKAATVPAILRQDGWSPLAHDPAHLSAVHLSAKGEDNRIGSY